MQNLNSVIIIGGGLAGLISAIHLAKHGTKVILFEKNDYPKHKVCGEYISNEVLDYLNFLNLDISSLQPVAISKLSFSLESGKEITTNLPMGGFGISRFTLDYYLYKVALGYGCEIKKETVLKVDFCNSKFLITTNCDTYESEITIGAFGKRSGLDVTMNRAFIKKKSNSLGVKAHFKVKYPDDLVGLHHFSGGYCGVSKVENNLINICYLTNYESFKKFKSIDEFQEKILFKNPHLQQIFKNAIIQFDKPLTISQVSFAEKESLYNHILMVGDTAGLIHPLCGNGMAMAIHSAKLASENILNFLNGKINRKQMEDNYKKQWNYNFKKRLQMGRMLSFLLQKKHLANIVLQAITIFPFLLPIIIKKTHGKPI